MLVAAARQEQHSCPRQYSPLHNAVVKDNWTNAERILKADGAALTAKIAGLGQTALHFAICRGNSTQFVSNLLEKMSEFNMNDLVDDYRDTPLHCAAYVGNTEAAKSLVMRCRAMLQAANKYDLRPITYAALYGHKETASYLLSEYAGPFSGQHGVLLVNYLIRADFYDIACYILENDTSLALEARSSKRRTILQTLSESPRAFQSKCQPGCWAWQRCLPRIFSSWIARGWVPNVESPPTDSNGTERHHTLPIRLLRLILSRVTEPTVTSETCSQLLGQPLLTATRFGNFEFVLEVIRAYPDSIWFQDENGRTLFHVAVIHRQEKIYNLLYQMSPLKYVVIATPDNNFNNILHLVGKMGKLNKISGAALKMQRELQWFQEVENIVLPSCKFDVNSDRKTPREVFTEEHKTLVEQGEKWMRDTATSYALISVLVVTLAFAAGFTVPGGTNQDNGMPIFLNDAAFMIFSVTNALALYSSATSLLMFLGILTSRYAEEDFLRALPKRLSIGLTALFFSIVFMLMAFSSSLYLLLSHMPTWILLPIIAVFLVPIILFIRLQYPLFHEILYSTFGPSIFGRQSEEELI